MPECDGAVTDSGIRQNRAGQWDETLTDSGDKTEQDGTVGRDGDIQCG